MLIESVEVFLAQVTNGSGDQGGQWGRVDSEVHVGIVKLSDEEHWHSIGQHPNVLVLVDLNVSWEHQTNVITVNDSMELRIVGHRRVPATDRILVDQVEQHHTIFAHHTGGCVAVGASLLQV